MNLYLDLFATFARIGALTFGGGYAMLPMFQRELVEHKKWCTQEELTDIFAIAQCTPGVIGINSSTYVGYKTGGFPGAVAATFGMLSPSVAIIVVVASFLWRYADNIWVQHALAGINACVCVLIFRSVIKLFRASVLDLPAALIFCVVLVLSFFAGFSPIPLVVAAGVCGLAVSRLRGGAEQ